MLLLLRLELLQLFMPLAFVLKVLMLPLISLAFASSQIEFLAVLLSLLLLLLLLLLWLFPVLTLLLLSAVSLDPSSLLPPLLELVSISLTYCLRLTNKLMEKKDVRVI